MKLVMMVEVHVLALVLYVFLRDAMQCGGVMQCSPTARPEDTFARGTTRV
jgi:hypothetical protein